MGKPAPRRNVISYRVDDVVWIRMSGLKATFPEHTWSATFDWLFDQPAVRDVILQRLVNERELPLEMPQIEDEERPDTVMADLGYVGR